MKLDTETQSLIVSAKLGNKEALNNLFARYQSRILRIARFYLTPEQRSRLKVQSMDVVQEVFMYALQHLKDFEPKSQGHFLNWLGKKVKHYHLARVLGKRHAVTFRILKFEIRGLRAGPLGIPLAAA